MKLRMGMVVGALAALAWLGCSSGNKAPTATGNAVTAQSGTVEGRVTDIDDQTFTVAVPNGTQTTLHLSARTGKVQLQKGQGVRATYEVDTAGNKIARTVTPMPATAIPGTTTTPPPGKGMTAQAEQVEGRVTDLDESSFTVQVPGGNSVKLQKSAKTQATPVRKGDDVRASFRVDTHGNNVAESVTVISAAPTGERQPKPNE